jgi:hypothetical protein
MWLAAVVVSRISSTARAGVQLLLQLGQLRLELLLPAHVRCLPPLQLLLSLCMLGLHVHGHAYVPMRACVCVHVCVRVPPVRGWSGVQRQRAGVWHGQSTTPHNPPSTTAAAPPASRTAAAPQPAGQHPLRLVTACCCHQHLSQLLARRAGQCWPGSRALAAARCLQSQVAQRMSSCCGLPAVRAAARRQAARPAGQLRCDVTCCVACMAAGQMGDAREQRTSCVRRCKDLRTALTFACILATEAGMVCRCCSMATVFTAGVAWIAPDCA